MASISWVSIDIQRDGYSQTPGTILYANELQSQQMGL